MVTIKTWPAMRQHVEISEIPELELSFQALNAWSSQAPGKGLNSEVILRFSCLFPPVSISENLLEGKHFSKEPKGSPPPVLETLAPTWI